MADLIEREYGTKRLENEYCKTCTRRGKYEIFGAACTSCWVMDCIEEFENAPAVNRWIPCSERLPEVYEKVLTYNDEGIIHDNFRLNLKDGSVGWSQGWGITHWQPRPEPPESEVQDDEQRG